MYAKLIKDNFVKLTSMAAIGTAAASLTLVSTVPPSFAAPAPGCVNVRNKTSNSITVRNCGSQQRLKAIIAPGPDSECRVLNPGQETTFRWRLGRFVGLGKC